MRALLLLVLALQSASCATNQALHPPDYAALQNDDGAGNMRKVAVSMVKPGPLNGRVCMVAKGGTHRGLFATSAPSSCTTHSRWLATDSVQIGCRHRVVRTMRL